MLSTPPAPMAYAAATFLLNLPVDVAGCELGRELDGAEVAGGADLLVAAEAVLAYGFTGGLDAAAAPVLAYGLTGIAGLELAGAGAAAADVGLAPEAPAAVEDGAGRFRPANCGAGDTFASFFFRASSKLGMLKGMVVAREGEARNEPSLLALAPRNTSPRAATTGILQCMVCRQAEFPTKAPTTSFGIHPSMLLLHI